MKGYSVAKALIALLLAAAMMLSFAPTATAAEDPLLLYYNFDEVDGTAVKDASGNGNDGTLHSGTNAPAVVNKPQLDGSNGAVLELDNEGIIGNNACAVDLPKSVFADRGAWTVVIEIKYTSAVGKEAVLVGTGASSNDRFVLYNRYDNSVGPRLATKRNNANFKNLGTNNTPYLDVDDGWGTYVFSLDADNNVKVWLNGVLTVDSTVTNHLTDYIKNFQKFNFRIGGAHYGTWLGSDALIDNIQVFDKVMNPTEVAQYWAAKEVAEPFEFYGTNVALESTLDMNFFVEADDVGTGEGLYAKITRTYADDRADDVRTVPFAQWNTEYLASNGLYYITYDGIVAKEMMDEVSIQIFNENNEAVSVVKTDSIHSYIHRMFAQVETKYQAVYAQMLRYGAAAQAEFNYDVQNPADADMTDAMKAYLVENVPASDSKTGDPAYAGMTLTLSNSIQAEMVFKNVTEAMRAVVSYEDHYGNTVSDTVTYTEMISTYGHGLYGVKIEGLAVADVYQQITVTIYEGAEVVATATDSMESYVARMSDGSDIYAAVMNFAAAAHGAFHNVTTE